MVVQASPQITAAQVLDAGRRAEADGRVDYAIQFYRHLADHHAGAPEAAVAREALTRLKRRARPESDAMTPRAIEPPPPLRALGRRQAGGLTHAESAAARTPLRIAPAGGSQPAPPLDLPEPVSGYFTGRLIAYGFAVVGVLLILAGLLALGATLLPAEMIASIPYGPFLLHPFAGPIAAGIGIALVLSGELARAIFDIARSSRDLAAIERAKAEHANGALH